MSKIAVKGAETGTGVFTIESPATNTDRTLTLPDEDGTILTSGGAIDVDSGAPADSLIVDSSGNLLVGKTVSTFSVDGLYYEKGKALELTTDSDRVLRLQRTTNDGSIVEFYKDGTTVGSIGVNYGSEFYISGVGSVTGLHFNTNGALPMVGGSITDNSRDLGQSGSRWDDVYATNGTIQTSDAREKENIASLTPAEMAVGKRLSSLFKTFTWVDKTRTHSGIIAQDVKAAFEAEGLDAGNYALFIHAEWTDEETGEQRDRMGIRYPELLSFVAAYNDQRFAAIEARLDALEGI
jgi:hypothetical protein